MSLSMLYHNNNHDIRYVTCSLQDLREIPSTSPVCTNISFLHSFASRRVSQVITPILLAKYIPSESQF